MIDTKNWEIEKVNTGALVARVFSPSNIALAKYWGKRDTALNLPTNGSISLTLKDFGSFTTVEFHESFKKDRLILNGVEEFDSSGNAPKKISETLSRVRECVGSKTFARVQSFNNFPTAAGLASSASGFSALVFAAAKALNADLTLKKLSEIARQGSGSSCRSLFEGFVEWERGELANGSDSVASSIFPKSHWNLKIFFAVANQDKKEEPSTGGMELTRKTSPYFDSWVDSAQSQLQEFKQAISKKDFQALAELTESNCIRMHASAMAASPPVLYWSSLTLEIMSKVTKMRKSGHPVFFTIDAGPNVVVICEPSAEESVYRELSLIQGISIRKTEIGFGSKLL